MGLGANRLPKFIDVGKQVLLLGSSIIVIIGVLNSLLPLRLALISLSAVLSSAVLFVFFLFYLDLEDEIEALRSDIEDLQSQVDNRQQGDGAEDQSEQQRTDGGYTATGQFPRDLYPEEEGTSGNGAVGGAVAGGIAGVPFGPIGAVAGGLLGAVVGNELEYQNLSDQKKQEIRRAAQWVLDRNTVGMPRVVEVEDMNAVGSEDESRWRIELLDRQNQTHVVYIYRNRNFYAYNAPNS